MELRVRLKHERLQGDSPAAAHWHTGTLQHHHCLTVPHLQSPFPRPPPPLPVPPQVRSRGITPMRSQLAHLPGWYVRGLFPQLFPQCFCVTIGTCACCSTTGAATATSSPRAAFKSRRCTCRTCRSPCRMPRTACFSWLHVTHHTSRITRHTSHFTHHTSHVPNFSTTHILFLPHQHPPPPPSLPPFGSSAAATSPNWHGRFVARGTGCCTTFVACVQRL